MSYLQLGERRCLAVLGCVAALLATLAGLSPTAIGWEAFLPTFALFGAIALFGMWLRLRGAMPRLAATLIAVGIFPVFSTLLALINYLQFPLARPLIDAHLLRLDAALGYDWAAGVAWLAEHPRLSAVMAAVYAAALPSLGLLLIWLGMTGRHVQMFRLLICGMLAAMATLAFWTAFPSFGPSAHVPLDPEVAARAGVLVTNAYGAHLLELGRVGVARIEGHQILGVVAFPSFHIVMGILAAWYARGTLLMVPAWAAASIRSWLLTGAAPASRA